MIFLDWPLMLAVTFLVSFTSRGTPLQQTLVLTILITISAVAAVFLKTSSHPILLYSGIFFILLMTQLFSLWALPQCAWRFLLSHLLVIFLIIFCFKEQIVLKNMISMIVAGAFGGLMIKRLWTVNSFYEDFSAAMIRLLTQMAEMTQLLSNGNLAVLSNAMKWEYPGWVFELGFNDYLKTGFRFFVIKAMQLNEILLRLSHLLSAPNTHLLLSSYTKALQDCLAVNVDYYHQLIAHLSKQPTLFLNNKWDDIGFLEKLFAESAGSFSVLDEAQSAATLALEEMILQLKKSRSILIELISVFPHIQTSVD